MVKGGLDMLFFEDEIRKVKDKLSPTELKEMMSQDPRINGRINTLGRQASWGFNTRQDAYRK
jgi:hypothetical protein